ncbi:MAG: type II toxin-antitoxin system VapC family toxin [Verrucomicrobiota bacterium]
MPDGILLDTSFLISLVDKNRPNHKTALKYFRHFAQDSIPMFLSTIVVSEFHLKQAVTDLPLDAIIILPFNLPDAMKAAELDFTKANRDGSTSRDSIKDDYKLLGQAGANDIAFLITEDERTLFKHCQSLRSENKIHTKPIKLVDGFDTSNFDPSGQKEFQDFADESSFELE